MLDIFLRFVDTIIPARPPTVKLRKETPEKFARFFSVHSYSNCIILANYQEELVRLAINANKFHNDRHATKLLSTLLDTWLTAQLKQSDKTFILVPIPLSKSRQRERGYNQVTKIINSLPNKQRVLTQKLLIRNKDTLPQTKLSKSQRISNVTDVFTADISQSTTAQLSHCHVILIDDVITTGSTMHSARKTLKSQLPKNCKLTCLALAH